MGELSHTFQPIVLLASETQVVSTNSDPVRLPDNVSGIGFVLDVTAAATAAADTMDVKIQTMIDGVNWVDVVHFTQLVGDGGAKRYIERVSAGGAEGGFENGTPLAAGEVRNLLGPNWRVVTTLVDGGGDDTSYTLSVMAIPM